MQGPKCAVCSMVGFKNWTEYRDHYLEIHSVKAHKVDVPEKDMRPIKTSNRSKAQIVSDTEMTMKQYLIGGN